MKELRLNANEIIHLFIKAEEVNIKIRLLYSAYMYIEKTYG